MKNSYVFVLGNFNCNKNCPYCIAKMKKEETECFENETKKLKQTIEEFKSNNIYFHNFVLSGNGEPSLYEIEQLKEIRDIVENSGLFETYRIQTSGELFSFEDKLNLFSNWMIEITVVSEQSKLDKEFFNYKEECLNSFNFKKTSNIRVNIVALKNNLNNLDTIIQHYLNAENIATVAIKILDNAKNKTPQSIWIEENAIDYSTIENIIEKLNHISKFINFKHDRFYFSYHNKKIITMNFATKNNYDYINLEEVKPKFKWHVADIEKGVYGEISKIEEELEEAKDALLQNNKLMFLIELSDMIGAIEAVAEKHNLSLSDLISFSNKVKESKNEY